MPRPSYWSRLPLERQVFWLALLGGVPAVVVVLVLLWRGDFPGHITQTLIVLVLGCWLGFAAAVHTKVIRPLQTVANLLSALRDGDFSIRGRGAGPDSALGDVMAEINTLGATLREQRLGALEATALLQTVMTEIEVAIFAFDSREVLQLVNPAGQRLLQRSADELIARPAGEVGLEPLLRGEGTCVIEGFTFAGADQRSRWSLRRSTFRERGEPHTLVVVADVGQALREQEVKAWQRLVRVLGHELNNSLAPIKSIAVSLQELLAERAKISDWEDDMRSGLNVIGARAEGLSRFMQAYAQLTKLPPPVRAPVDIGPMIRRVVALELRLPVIVNGGPDVTAHVDGAQVEQVLINLVANATEAALEARENGDAGAGVHVLWSRAGGSLEIQVEDDGLGIANPTNLFVPFFTTKQKGSGIGLVLCRQIVENHGGSISLENRTGGVRGCVARLRFPLPEAVPEARA